MKKLYLILVVWGATVLAAESIPSEELIQKIQSATAINIPSTLIMKEEEGNLTAGIIITADLQGNAATATHAAYAAQAVEAEHAAQADKATHAMHADSAQHAQSADRATQADHALHADQAEQTKQAYEAQHAAHADTAAHADYATHAEQAHHALSADQAAQTTRAIQAECASCADTAHIFTDPLAGDVTGNQNATIVQHVGGKSAEDIAHATQTVQTATDTACASTLVLRDVSGNFAAYIITADLHGNAATATYATQAGQAERAERADSALNADQTTHATQADSAQHALRADKADQAQQAEQARCADKAVFAEQANTFTEPLSGDVIGSHASTVVQSIGGQPAATIAAVVQQVQQATSDYSSDTLVRRDAKGDFSARNIKATLLGNATTATCANTFHQPLAGDVVGKQFATVVHCVGGQSAAHIAAAVQTVQAATPAYTPNTVIQRDSNGDFTARVITADLQGNAVTATQAVHATNADKALQAEQATHAVQADSAEHAIIADKALNAEQAVHALDADRAVQADNATQANTFTASLDGDVTGNQNSTVVARVGGQSAAQIAATVQTVQAATARNTADTLIMRDSAGNFEAQMITVHGSTTHPTDVVTKQYVDTVLTSVVQQQNHPTSLAGDVTGMHDATVVTSVGGQSAAQIAAAIQTIQSATSTYMPNALIQRDSNGDFAAHIIIADLQGNAATATQALQANHADIATRADSALKTEHALHADQATEAVHATQADSARHALNADQAQQALQATRAMQAECALCADIARTFTDPLAGDVIGNQQSTMVASVGGQTAAQIAAAVKAVADLTAAPTQTLICITDAGNAAPKAGKLAIRGGQNIKVRGSDASVVISLNQSPSVTGSLTAGTTITAGTGLQVVSGGASITGETKINIAGSALTTVGNPSSTLVCNGPVCCKQVNSGEGTPLGIDADGNVVMLSDGVRAYSQLIGDLATRYPILADVVNRSSPQTPMLALLHALIAIVDEQHKRLERIECCVYKQ